MRGTVPMSTQCSNRGSTSSLKCCPLFTGAQMNVHIRNTPIRGHCLNEDYPIEVHKGTLLNKTGELVARVSRQEVTLKCWGVTGRHAYSVIYMATTVKDQ